MRIFRVLPGAKTLRLSRSYCSVARVGQPNTAEDQELLPFHEIPGPDPLPALGNIWRFFPLIGDLADIERKDFIPTLHARYGPVVRLDGLFTEPKLFVSDPHLIEQVFRNEGKWPARKGVDCFEYYYKEYRSQIGPALGTSDGEQWQNLRSKINPIVMQPRNVKDYMGSIDSVSQDFIGRMRYIRDDKFEMPANFHLEIGKWAMESIVLVCLDVRLGALAKDLAEDSEAVRLLESVQGAIGAASALEFGGSPYRIISTPTWRKFKQCMDFFTECALRHVMAAVDRLGCSSQQDLENRHFTVLEKILLAFQSDPLQAVAITMDLLLAGMDTTSNQTAQVLYQLSRHPEKQRALQEELDRVIPDPSQPLTSAQLDQLRYLRACIKEAFRVLPVIPAVSRIAARDLNMHGYRVPQGTNVICSYTVPAVDESIAPRATEFLPERWLHGGQHLKIKHPFAHLPFGFGPRMCIGKRFADMEMEVFTAKLFRSHSLEWKYPVPEMDQNIMLFFTSPLKFTMRDRL